MKDEYLSSLVGRAVQVYRGGPDSNVGVLLDVNEDYLTLQKEDGEIIYYKTAHIKSIKENSQIRYNSILKVYDANNLVKATTFNELLGHFKDQTIRINGKGPESKFGTLIDVKDDFLVLYTEQDGLIFYKEQHIKSFSHAIPTTSQEVVEEKENVDQPTVTEEVTEETAVDKMKEVYEQIIADNTANLMTNLKYSWIKINRKGPESMEGLLVEANDDYLVLVVNNEIFRIATYHVKNFSLSINPLEEQKDEQKDEQKEESKNAQTTNTSTDNEQSNESQKQESTDQETSTRSTLTYEEELNLANKRRNRRLKKKARQGKTKK
jgi:spore coat protein B